MTKKQISAMITPISKLTPARNPLVALVSNNTKKTGPNMKLSRSPKGIAACISSIMLLHSIDFASEEGALVHFQGVPVHGDFPPGLDIGLDIVRGIYFGTAARIHADGGELGLEGLSRIGAPGVDNHVLGV